MLKYLKSYNESLRDKMKPKSDDEILNDLGDLTPNELLFQSVNNNYLNGVKIALERGADVNFKDKYGETALLHASYKGHKDIVEFLLKNGADVNIKNQNGWTALYFALKYKNEDIVKILKKYGATE